MSELPVTHCLCHQRAFEEIKQYAQTYDISTLRELQEHEYCSCGCGLCIPYVKKMLDTGRTCFAPFEADDYLEDESGEELNEQNPESGNSLA